MSIVASFVGGWGHAEPLLPLANLARSLGHHVGFAGQAGVLDRVREHGYSTHVVGPDTLATTRRPLMPVDRAAERAVMRDHFVARFGRMRAETLGALFDRERPDLVICDEVDVGSVVAAERRGIPCVTVVVLAAGLLMAPDVVGPAWRALREEQGVAPDPGGSRVAGTLAIAPFPRSLRSPLARVAGPIEFVRPPILDQVARPLASGNDTGGARPLVYATLGTVFNLESGDLLSRLVEAMNAVSESFDVEVVITTGPGIDPATLPAPRPGVRIAEFIAQRELLGRCAAVVSHAGSGTLGAVLSLGIPVVTLALGADQPDNADRCAQLGVGITLDPLTATPAEIAEAARTTLVDPTYRLAASSLAAEARAQRHISESGDLRRLLESA